MKSAALSESAQRYGNIGVQAVRLFYHRGKEIGVLLVAGLALAATPCTATDDTADARLKIEALLADQDKAASAENIDGMVACDAANVERIDEEGDHWGTADERKRLSRLFEGMTKTFFPKRSTQQETTITGFVLKGDKAYLVLSQHRTVTPEESSQSAQLTMVDDNVLREVWIQGPKGWKMLRLQTLSTKSTVGGQGNPFVMHTTFSQELKSPDGRYVASLGYRDGLTFGYYYVTLQPLSGWHKSEKPEIANEGINKITEVAAEGLTGLKWSGNHRLIVQYAGSRKGADGTEFVQKKTLWNDVHIIYQAAR